MGAWTLTVAGMGVAAAYADLRWRTIPVWLTSSGLVGGLLYHGVRGGLGGAGAAAALGLVLGGVLWRLGAAGGGDAKLLAALGAMAGLHLWSRCVEWGAIAAGLGALAQCSWQGRLGFLAADLGAIIRGWRSYGWAPHPEHNLATPGGLTAPLAPALALGLLCALWLG